MLGDLWLSLVVYHSWNKLSALVSNPGRRADYVLALPSGRVLAAGVACCRSVASICNDHHKACSLSGLAQQAAWAIR